MPDGIPNFIFKNKKPLLRVLLLIIIISSAIPIASAYLQRAGTVDRYEESSQVPFSAREQIAPQADNITVVTSQGSPDLNRPGRLLAFAPDGRLFYHHDSYDIYFDVDPIPHTNSIILVAAKEVPREQCGRDFCNLMLVDQINLTTGERSRLYQKYKRAKGSSQWHDADLLNGNRLLVADLGLSRTYIVNYSTGIITWSWTAQTDYPISGGGAWPTDWTHLNDVEKLLDGRIMVSLRNQDQVVFIDQASGLQNRWTLGEEDNYSILSEQHNPDYLPESQGGPAVLVGDSENNRVIEYQFHNGSWRQTWVYAGDRITWPRDADRLPNGNTLIANSNGNEILEINKNNSVIWQVPVTTPYDVERFGTGDESNGPTAKKANLSSQYPPEEQQNQESQRLSILVFNVIQSLVPSWVLNGINFILPYWLTLNETLPLMFAFISTVGWILIELRWSSVALEFQWPLRIKR